VQVLSGGRRGSDTCHLYLQPPRAHAGMNGLLHGVVNTNSAAQRRVYRCNDLGPSSEEGKSPLVFKVGIQCAQNLRRHTDAATRAHRFRHNRVACRLV
jgi:hypothetical protein